MNNGKYHRKRRLRWRREFVLVCSIAILLIGMVGGSLAYLFMGTDPVTNTFTAPDIDVTIPEDFEQGGDEKKNVTVKNGCDFEVYARATYVVYWQDADGKVYPVAPIEGTDYTISIGSGWTKNGDYWYYNTKLAANAESGNFIVSCKETDSDMAESYKLVVDVIGEVVQAEPIDAVQNVWGMTYDGSAWSVYTGT